jgi:hypothetical protein
MSIYWGELRCIIACTVQREVTLEACVWDLLHFSQVLIAEPPTCGTVRGGLVIGACLVSGASGNPLATRALRLGSATSSRRRADLGTTSRLSYKYAIENSAVFNVPSPVRGASFHYSTSTPPWSNPTKAPIKSIPFPA